MRMLPHARFQPAPLRDVRPDGWLLDFLHRQARGLTGHVAVSGYPYGYKFWGSAEDQTKGSYAAWWPFEQTAYWIDGALKCGFLAGDDALRQQALDEVDYAVEHAAPDGFIGPDLLRAKDRWPHAVFFRAVLAQYEITGDRRYIDALARHYRSTPHPMGWDRDVTGVEILLLLYQETGEPDLLDMACRLYAQFVEKWPHHDAAPATLRSEKPQHEHGVTFNEEAKLAAMLYSATGDEALLEAVVHGYDKLNRNARLADGLHSCSEFIQGRDARDMHETCDITDHTWALAYLLQATGHPRYADQIEQIIFNALPGSITPDFKALQYLSCPNQVVVTHASNHNLKGFMRGLNWMSYRPDHEVQCCPGNLHRAMPNYISRMWMLTPDGGIAAALYGPGVLRTTLAETPVTITAATRYPFEQSVRFTLQPDRPVDFPFAVRIPAWCNRASLTVNGASIDLPLVPGTFVTLQRQWCAGDVVQLELPFELAMETWPRGGVSLSYGPLTLALPVPTRAEIERDNSTIRQRQEALGDDYHPRPTLTLPDFPAWNLYPAGAWNYALCLEGNWQQNVRVEWNPTCSDPWDAANPPLRVMVKARRVRRWRITHARRTRQLCHAIRGGVFALELKTVSGDFLFTPPLPHPASLPERLADREEEIALIPYGATRLRVTVFPSA